MGIGLSSFFEGPSVPVPMGEADWRWGNNRALYGMTIVDLNNLGYRDEPSVLAKDVAQGFYVKDMASKPKKGINKS